MRSPRTCDETLVAPNYTHTHVNSLSAFTYSFTCPVRVYISNDFNVCSVVTLRFLTTLRLKSENCDTENIREYVNVSVRPTLKPCMNISHGHLLYNTFFLLGVP